MPGGEGGGRVSGSFARSDPQKTKEAVDHRRVQKLCESRGGRPGLPVLVSLMVSVDVKQH